MQDLTHGPVVLCGTKHDVNHCIIYSFMILNINNSNLVM